MRGAAALLCLSLSAPAAAQPLPPEECEEPRPLVQRAPFTLRDNVVTGVAAAADGAASVLIHTLPAFGLIPLLMVALDAALAGRAQVQVEFFGPTTVRTTSAILVLGGLMLAYAAFTPIIDAAIVLAVRSIDLGRMPRPEHVVATVLASYLSFPVAYVGAIGLVGLISVLTEPQRANPGSSPLIETGSQLLLYSLTIEAVMVVVRPLALAMFERAGNAFFPRELPESDRVVTEAP